MKKILITLSVLAFSLSGCKMLDAIDSVNSMPPKMDELKNKIDETNTTVNGTNGQIAKTNHAVHLQTLLIALTEMRKTENWNYLDPAYAIMPAAKTFAEEAELHELSDFAYFVQQSVGPSMSDYAKSTTECFDYLLAKNKVATLPEETPNDDAVTKALREAAMSKYNYEYARCAVSYNRFTYSLVTALQAVFGRVTQERIEQLVDSEIVKGGENRKAAFAALNARYTYLFKIQYEKIVKAKIGTEEEATPKLFDKAINSLRSLDYILSIGYRREINNFRFSLEEAPGIAADDQITIDSIRFDDKLTTATHWKNVANMVTKLEKNYPSSIETVRQDIRAAVSAYGIVSMSEVF